MDLISISSSGIKFYNLTPHACGVVIGGSKIYIPPSGYVARLIERDHLHSLVEGLKIVRKSYNTPVDFPPELLGVPLGVLKGEVTLLIVSQIFLHGVGISPTLAPYTELFVAPDTGTTCLRTPQGHIDACTQFVRL